MFAVIFDVYPKPERYDDYLALAGMLRPDLEEIDGFLTVERFAARDRPGWILSLSLWRDEAALVRWRTHGRHREAQERGRREIFQDYRLRVGRVVADAIPGQAEQRPDQRMVDNDRHAHRPTVIALLDVEPEDGAQIDLAALTGVGVEGLDGFLGSDQFDSIYVQGKVLSRSSWRDETAVRAWQARVLEHVAGRAPGGPSARVRLRVVAIERDYGMFERAQAPH